MSKVSDEFRRANRRPETGEVMGQIRDRGGTVTEIPPIMHYGPE